MRSGQYTDCEIGKRIKIMRKLRGLTQSGLADLVGVTRPTVISWERGVTVPVLYTLRRLAETLGVTLEWLMEGDVRE